MNLLLETALETRRSVKNFKPDETLSSATLDRLMDLTRRTPTAYNLQNWRAIAVTSPEAKARLRSMAFDQSQIEEAAVTFIMVGNTDGYRQIGQRLEPSVSAGIMPQGVANAWVDMVNGSHGTNPVLRRDEAFRSASLAAMTLMFAAETLGLGSGGVSGFEPDRVHDAFELGEGEVPVVLVCIGTAMTNNWSQKPRLPVSEIYSQL